MPILADASLPDLQTVFPAPFCLTFYQHAEQIPSLLPGKAILLCRSTLKVDAALLHQHTLEYVATASSGTDHLDEAFLTGHGITLVDAKGCNAPAVADYVMASLAWLELNHPLPGRQAGIIGCGEVGLRVADRLQAVQWDVHHYDPPKAEKDPTFRSCSLDELAACDLICVHANLHDALPYPSRNSLNAAFLSRLKPGTVIINASRGGIINETDLLAFPHLGYCTDVYLNEPAVNAAILSRALLCTPHIAGHSIEAKQRAVTLLSDKLHEYYGLKPLHHPSAARQALPVAADRDSWPSLLLSLYDPVSETNAMKEAGDKQRAFLTLRKAHSFRHDFSTYSSAISNPVLMTLLGAD
ncbi:4-phosphoerythronate dehydrogenase [Legionella taurinensis]|uniref:4-phosphoerythronate dehydrogenase n=1 Tax=Legionella taurinensis TaxID=70611 RepID=A0A3A5L872_9GAMM|nr:4-phosphoerythronate dehydrogenase [Legionella taurinensis]MDX1836637.1 4-phosphoerythronate dehydrogenase [Legionella taurinensis]PUT43144.1 4-phosphoerythronate dehydrogenase [Legionella taurinensis]PUT45699.1 4-phosphoerythronate dehydrogenase [Legionella taurinensis]PUT47068.1 4-phosphoerythronate dehydrogenase [Legionella taurinensis]PUT49468.1 4-phosphoerythronate dehydrogenase [Legionella taurinensis]